METILSQKEIIEQIHHEFYTASESALEEAKIYLTSLSVNTKLNDLNKLGFVNAQGVKDHLVTNEKIEQINQKSNLLISMQQSYPLYKFITAEDVEKICNKYKLACAPIDRYLGDVPNKNVQDISKFVKHYNTTQAYEYVTEITYHFPSLDKISIEYFKDWLKKLNKKPITEYEANQKFKSFGGNSSGIHCQSERIMMSQNLHICAPKKDLNLKGLAKKGSIFSIPPFFKIKEITIPDPVVLCKIKEGYLIITAWGDEASDALVVNEKMN